MVWRFVRVYGRNGFGDYLIDYALQVDSECLHALTTGGAELSGPAVSAIRQNVERLTAAWELLDPMLDDTKSANAAKRRLTQLRESLAGRHDQAAMLATAKKLVVRTRKSKTVSAIEHFVEVLEEEPRRATLDRPTVALASTVFQADSGGWRGLTVPLVTSREQVAGFVRSYCEGAKVGRAAHNERSTAVLHAWRRRAMTTVHQLDIVKPAFSEATRARRWYLGQLDVALGRHRDLDMLLARLSRAPLSDKEHLRVEQVLAARMQRLGERAVALYPYAYDLDAEAFAELILEDVEHLGMANAFANVCSFSSMRA